MGGPIDSEIFAYMKFLRDDFFLCVGCCGLSFLVLMLIVFFEVDTCLAPFSQLHMSSRPVFRISHPSISHMIRVGWFTLIPLDRDVQLLGE